MQIILIIMENYSSVMRVVCILTVWNEIDFLPLKVKYCRLNKLIPYFIDNESDDGTWEWLQRHKIRSHRMSTNGSFSLRALQAEIVTTLHRIKPDWVVYNGCDLFPVTLRPLHDELVDLDRRGFNSAWIDCIHLYNTGEERPRFDPFNTFFYHGPVQRLKMIHKYNPYIAYHADDVSFPGQRIGWINGVMINYGQTKTKEERMRTLERRKKAWATGEPRAYGTHYLEGEKNNWVWDRRHLTDIRQGKWAKHVIKLQQLASLVNGQK